MFEKKKKKKEEEENVRILCFLLHLNFCIFIYLFIGLQIHTWTPMLVPCLPSNMGKFLFLTMAERFAFLFSPCL